MAGFEMILFAGAMTSPWSSSRSAKATDAPARARPTEATRRSVSPRRVRTLDLTTSMLEHAPLRFKVRPSSAVSLGVGEPAA